jgi:hypothetical protein
MHIVKLYFDRAAMLPLQPLRRERRDLFLRSIRCSAAAKTDAVAIAEHTHDHNRLSRRFHVSTSIC